MGSNVSELKTDAALLEALNKAASKKLTSAEKLEQRVSFVFGSIDPESGATREHIKHIIVEQEGLDVE